MHTILSLVTDESESTLSASDTNAFLSSILPKSHADRFRRLVDASRIQRRNALASYDDLRRLDTLESRNSLFMAAAIPIGERVAVEALGRAGVESQEIDLLIVTSSTGFSVPTLDQHLASALGLRPDARCLFLTGVGCAGGVRAIALAGDLLSGDVRQQYGLVISIELCSPWLQVSEPSPDDVLSNIVFGDGAAAAVIGGSARARKSQAGPTVVASHTERWPQSLDARGAKITQSGFRHFASPTLPRVLRAHLGRTVHEFLGAQQVTALDIQSYAVNPSDHRVLDTVARVLDIPAHLMQPAWTTWEQHGNTLSAGPLYVIDALRRESPMNGELSLVIVLGPGLTCDLTLLRWREPLSD